MFAALNITGMIDRIERLVGHKVFSSDVYFINYLPSDLQVLDVVLICSAALLMSFLATLYPSCARRGHNRPSRCATSEREGLRQSLHGADKAHEKAAFEAAFSCQADHFAATRSRRCRQRRLQLRCTHQRQ